MRLRARFLVTSFLVLTTLATSGSAAQNMPKETLEVARKMAGMVETGRAEENPSRFRAAARKTLQALNWGSIVPRGQMSIALVPEGQDLVRRLQTWTEPEAELPSAEEMKVWVNKLEDIYAIGSRMAIPAPSRQKLNRARQVLEVELQRSMYEEARGGGSDLTQRLGNLVARYIMNPLFGERSRAARRILVLVCFALLALLLAHVVWELLQAAGGAGRTGGGSRATGTERPIGYGLSVQQFLGRGDEARESNKPFRAMGLYYLALVTFLAAKGWTTFDRTLTNWEHYQKVRRSDGLDEQQLQQLAEVTRFFDESLYGKRRASGQDVQWLRDQVTKLVEGGEAT